jgi:hypothetical protein
MWAVLTAAGSRAPRERPEIAGSTVAVADIALAASDPQRSVVFRLCVHWTLPNTWLF